LREREIPPPNHEVAPARAPHRVEESRRPEDERTQVVEEDVEGDGFCRGHAECSNATPPDAYSRQLVLDASGPPRPAAAIHRRLCSHLRRAQQIRLAWSGA